MTAHFVRRILASSVHSWLPRAGTETNPTPDPNSPSSDPAQADKTSDTELVVLGATVIVLLILIGLTIYVFSRHKHRYLQDENGDDIEDGPSIAKRVGKQVESNLQWVEDKYNGNSTSQKCDGSEQECSKAQKKDTAKPSAGAKTQRKEGSSPAVKEARRKVERDIAKVDRVAESIRQHEEEQRLAANKKSHRAAKKVKEAGKDGERKWNQWRGREDTKAKGKESAKEDERTKLLQSAEWLRCGRHY